ADAVAEPCARRVRERRLLRDRVVARRRLRELRGFCRQHWKQLELVVRRVVDALAEVQAPAAAGRRRERQRALVRRGKYILSLRLIANRIAGRCDEATPTSNARVSKSRVDVRVVAFGAQRNVRGSGDEKIAPGIVAVAPRHREIDRLRTLRVGLALSKNHWITRRLRGRGVRPEYEREIENDTGRDRGTQHFAAISRLRAGVVVRSQGTTTVSPGFSSMFWRKFLCLSTSW